jgi:hypothetical protein
MRPRSGVVVVDLPLVYATACRSRMEDTAHHRRSLCYASEGATFEVTPPTPVGRRAYKHRASTLP